MFGRWPSGCFLINSWYSAMNSRLSLAATRGSGDSVDAIRHFWINFGRKLTKPKLESIEIPHVFSFGTTSTGMWLSFVYIRLRRCKGHQS